MKIIFQYDKKEFIKGYRESMLISRNIKWLDFAVYTACVVGSFFIQGVFRVLVLLAGLIGFGGLFFQLQIKPKKIFETVEMFREEYRITVDEEGIKVHTKELTGDHRWETIQKMDENDNFFFMEEQQGGYLFIPKRVMTEEEQNEFKEYYQSKMQLVKDRMEKED